MAQVLRMPSTMELPTGPRRQFVEELFSHYRDAGRPTLRVIAEEIDENPEFDAFTASRETIRKMLRGKTVPLSWAVVDAVLTVLCARAGVDPDAERWADGFNGEPTSHRQSLRNLWNEAIDAPPTPPARSSAWGGQNDPWAASSRPYADEPPF
ncbi:hypothetical protein [Streptomyces sp. G7(2002)]|uniref:hypothetical protein n=1 Tax=Streptomyces sp. G7(2002) TaxID=2971798 RepID=UPI00237DE3F9|nr:hypothetical protein [Streptomyces sp. G7(2002)]WDT52560.1 hypothetical protein NUT86_00045 [Streptomyces sp. G7(2002)]WDT59787.1 hypothetical protein NUT86_40460 [Streptomyces sp. G7(2002)]